MAALRTHREDLRTCGAFVSKTASNLGWEKGGKIAKFWSYFIPFCARNRKCGVAITGPMSRQTVLDPVILLVETNYEVLRDPCCSYTRFKDISAARF